jgi:hypothetical protein
MDEEEIETYSLGGFSEGETALFDEHLLICDLCRTKVEASDEYIAAMRGAARLIRQAARQAAGSGLGAKPKAAGSA